MRDYGVAYKSVPLICDSSGAICLAPKPNFSWESETHKSETPLLETPCRKGDIEIKYIDTERQSVDIFIKPLDVAHFASL
jgi:hypothetical protein